ncbi:MAG: response regulator [Lachnospiraceae bacterium]|nr:response regulator [Lachnospiraceae bacterium]
MKTVLIVEDEKMIRQGIKSMVQRSGVPIDVIMECNNGEVAWEVLKQQPVDVMFTDIRMPKMDGIELVKHAETLENPPMIVAISGFDDFSYAVEMLRAGVREYILKPVEREKISAILHKLQAELDGKSQVVEHEKNIGRQQLKQLLRMDNIAEEEIKSIEVRYEDLFYKTPFVVCISEPKAVKDPDGNVISFDDVNDGQVFILEESNRLPFVIKEFSDSAVGISRPHEGIREVNTAYKEAVQAREQAFCTGGLVIYNEEGQNIPEGLKASVKKLTDETFCMQRLQLIGTSRTDELDAQWEKVFEEAKRGNLEPSDFFFIMNDFLNNVAKVYRNALSEDDINNFKNMTRFLAYPDIDVYRESLMDKIIALHEAIHVQDDTGSQRKLQMAVDYIEKNYNKDLNMAVVSNYISMNYSMLSYLFKQYTGKNFVSYLKEIRIREAKKLLADTDLKIIEISQRVGYENEKHFMKTFKSEVGVSATEYRRNMQREDLT